MAGAIRSSSSLSAGSRTNSVLTAPSGIQNNDILLALLDVGGSTSPSVTPPAGFTEITTTGWPLTYTRSDPWTVKAHAYWKVASGESGNYTFTHSSASTEGCLLCLSGCDTSTPISPTSTAYADNNHSTSTVIAPGLTTPRDSSVVVFVASCWNDMNTTPPTGTTPTFTEYYDGGAGGVFYVAAGVLATAGATGDATLTIGANEYAAAAGLICVQASSGGAPASSILRQMLMHHGA